MKVVHFLALAVLAVPLLGETAIRTRQDARKATNDLVFSNVEQLEAFGQGTEYALPKIVALKNEILSCGLTYSGTPCLDTQFENFGSDGIKDLDTADKTGYIFFSRFRMKKDSRVLLMSVIANKFDCVLDQKDPTKCQMDPKTRKPVPSKVFRTGNIWVIEPGREKPEIYMKDFLNCMANAEACPMRAILAFDPIGNTDQDLLTQLSNISPKVTSPDFRRLYHLAVKSAALPTKSLIEQSANLLTARTSIMTGSGNALYRSAFLNLVITKFANFNPLVIKTATEISKVAAIGSEEATIAALALSAKGDRTSATFAALKAGLLNPRVSAEVRTRAISAYANTAILPTDKDFLVSLLGSADNVVRKQAYSSIQVVALAEDNLPAISRLLANPAVNIRGNALRALGQVPGPKSMEKMATMIQDKDVDIADMASTGLKLMLKELLTITDESFIFLLSNTTVQVKPRDRREEKVLSENVLPKRKAALELAFSMIDADEITVLTRLRNLIATPKIASSIRVEAVSFIGQINLAVSTQVLIKLLADIDPKVSAQVVESLKNKILTDDHVDPIYAIAQNKTSVVIRRNALAVLGQISTKKATTAILLKSKENIDANSYLVRKDAAVLLGKTFSTEATNRLIEMMNDANAEVRATALQVLSKGDRLLEDAQVNSIANLIHTLPESEKGSVVTLLAASLSSPATALILADLARNSLDLALKTVAIRALMTDDSIEVNSLLIELLPSVDEALRLEVEAVLNARILDSSLTTVLGALLANENPALRSVAVKQLARQNSVEAVEVLKARLAIETDEALKAEINAIINAPIL